MGTLNEVKKLLTRMERTPNGGSNFIFEELNEVSCKWRDIGTPDEFYDILQGIGNGKFVTFGYVNVAKIAVPKGKRLNPVTNRMNQFDDYETLGRNLGVEDGVQLVNIIKLITYNMRWQTSDEVNKQYSDYKKTRDELGSKYGVEFGKAAYKTNTMNYGSQGGVSSYAGDNQENMGHTYTNLNMSGISPLSTKYYMVLSNGSLKEIDKSKLEMLPSKRSQSTIDKLMAAGATEQDVAPLKTMSYTRFEHSHLLFLSATTDGIPTVYINTNLSDKIEGITNANKQELVNLAKERYSKYME